MKFVNHIAMCASSSFFAELVFAIVKVWFFLLGINFCDFREAEFG